MLFLYLFVLFCFVFLPNFVPSYSGFLTFLKHIHCVFSFAFLPSPSPQFFRLSLSIRFSPLSVIQNFFAMLMETGSNQEIFLTCKQARLFEVQVRTTLIYHKFQREDVQSGNTVLSLSYSFEIPRRKV